MLAAVHAATTAFVGPAPLRAVAAPQLAAKVALPLVAAAARAPSPLLLVDDRRVREFGGRRVRDRAVVKVAALRDEAMVPDGATRPDLAATQSRLV